MADTLNADNFKTHLATEILSEHKTISYRILSRQLRVHVNDAKCMLYEFYERENEKKPGSLYATYLVAGIRKQRNLHGSDLKYEARGPYVDPTYDLDPEPESSYDLPSYPSNSAPDSKAEVTEERDSVPLFNMAICREEFLEQTKAKFAKITDIHIYSLSPVRPQYTKLFRDYKRVVFNEYHAKNDPLIHNKDYGIIQNPFVKRRKLANRPIDAPGIVKRPGQKPPTKAKPEEKVETKTAEDDSQGAVKSEPQKVNTYAPPSRPDSRNSMSAQGAGSKPKATLKRDDSALFKAFAKHSNKPKLERKDTDASTGSDVKMSGMDDNDEGEDSDAMFLDTGTTTKKRSTTEIQKDKEERAAKLRKMMDDDANEPEVPTVAEATDIDAEPPAAKVGEDADAPNGDGDQVDWSDSDAEKSTTKEQNEAPRKRRGKRKIKKRITKTDADGYLVTEEKEVWESFSEDEPEPETKPVPAPAKKETPPLNSSAPVKGGQKPAAKTGAKGNLMSYFGKK